MKKHWCIAQVDATFLAALEIILALYAFGYDAAYPVCFDERPCFLIGDVVAPLIYRKARAWSSSITPMRN